MPFRTAGRVKETTTTTGTGTLTLAGAMTGFQKFSDQMATSDTCYYTIQAVDGSGNPTGQWETGLGTLASGTTLARTLVIASSSGTTKITFSAGTKQIWMDYPAYGLYSQPICTAYQNVAATVLAANTQTTVPIDTPTIDAFSSFNGTTHRFSPPIAGLYRIYCRATFTGPTSTGTLGYHTDTLIVGLNGSPIDGTEYGNWPFSSTVPALQYSLPVESIVQMNGAGDYVSILAQTDLANRTVSGDSLICSYYGPV